MDQGRLIEVGPINLTLTETLIIVNIGRYNSRVHKEKAESTVPYFELSMVSVFYSFK